MASKGHVTTRVHSELLLLDKFSRKGFEFVDGVKYIGGSKGACYFCACYIDRHKKDFIKPRTHNKVIVGCRAPEPDPEFDKRGNGNKVFQEMRSKMNWALDQEILARLDAEQSHIRFQHCSSDGSSRAPSVASRTAMKGPALSFSSS